MARFLLFLLLLFGGSIQPSMSQDPSAGTSSTIIISATAPNAVSLSTPATSTTAAAGASKDDSPFKLGEMVWIILLGGMLGGFANYLRTSGQLKPNVAAPQPDPAATAGETTGTTLPASVPTTAELRLYLLTCLLLGVVASALVPLFLKSMSSDLLEKRTDINLLVFSGFCLLAAISSSSFIDALTQRILNQMKNLRDQTVTEANRAAESKQQTEVLKEHTETLLESVRSEQESLREKIK